MFTIWYLNNEHKDSFDRRIFTYCAALLAGAGTKAGMVFGLAPTLPQFQRLDDHGHVAINFDAEGGEIAFRGDAVLHSTYEALVPAPPATAAAGVLAAWAAVGSPAFWSLPLQGECPWDRVATSLAWGWVYFLLFSHSFNQ